MSGLWLHLCLSPSCSGWSHYPPSPSLTSDLEAAVRKENDMAHVCYKFHSDQYSNTFSCTHVRVRWVNASGMILGAEAPSTGWIVSDIEQWKNSRCKEQPSSDRAQDPLCAVAAGALPGPRERSIVDTRVLKLEVSPGLRHRRLLGHTPLPSLPSGALTVLIRV